MIKITIKSNLDIKSKDILEKKIKLNDAIHDAGFMLEAEIKRDIASYPSVDLGRFMSSVETDNSRAFQSKVFSNVVYAKYLEFGTSSHFIKPTTKKALRWKGGKEWFFSKGHQVSGIKPRRHFGRTANKMKSLLISFVNERLK